MNLSDLEEIFNRAVSHIFCRRKLLLTYLSLLLLGVLVVFFRGLSLSARPWLNMSMGFLSFFLSSSGLLTLGIVLIRAYREELLGRKVRYRYILSDLKQLLTGTSTIAVPMITAFSALWIVLGVYNLLRAIPGIGNLLGALLSFAPFLLVLGTLILCLVNFVILFFVAPILALQSRTPILRALSKRVAQSAFATIFLALIAILPAVSIVGFEVLAAHLAFPETTSAAQVVFTWFFVMPPFAALLVPVVIFFFNFATEAHALANRRLASQEEY